MSDNNYAVRQAQKDREYAEYYQSPEYLRWLDSLSLEERRRLEADGLLKPMLDRAGSTMRDEDASESTFASEDHDIAAEIDDVENAPNADTSLALQSGEERLWDVLRRLLGELMNQKNAKLSIECLAVVSGVGFMGDSMTEIAHRNGVTRAAVSKRCVELAERLGVPPSRAMRSLTARASYARTQYFIRRNHEQRNRQSR
jgi:hypothetical protein